MSPDFDIDKESIKFGGKWRTEKELQQRIKDKVDDGDYDVAAESEALKDLKEYLGGLTEYNLRITQEMLDAVEKASDKDSVGIGETIRKAIEEFLD